MSRGDYHLFVDWSGNGDFLGTGEAIDMGRVLDTTWTRGRDFASQLTGRSVAGRLTALLNNESEDYSSFNTGSPLAGNLLPGRKVQLQGGHEGFPYTWPLVFSDTPLWTGYLLRIQPQPKVGEANTAILEAIGPLGYLNQRQVALAMGTSKVTGTSIGDILDEVGWAAAARTLDAGQTTMTRFWVDKEKFLQAIRQVEETEAGFIVESMDGKIVFEDRHHRLASPHTVSQASFSDAPANLISNGDMEDGDPPTGWSTAGAGATFSRSNAQAKLTTYSFLITRAGTDANASAERAGAAFLRGDTFSAGCWVYATVASRARISCWDNIIGHTYSSYHSGAAGWEWLSASATFSATASTARIYLHVVTGDTTAYFDGAQLVEGTIASEAPFEPQGYQGIDQEDPLPYIFNILEAEVQLFTVAGAPAVAWTLAEVGASSPKVERNGGTRTFWASYPNPDSATDGIGINVWTTPVATTDWTANSQAGGGGTDLTASIGVAVVAYGNELKITLTNNHATLDAYMTFLQARGTIITRDDPIKVSSEDTTSQGKYGERTYPNPGPFIPDTQEAQDWADMHKGIYKDPIPILALTVNANRDDSHMFQVLLRDISDRVTVVADGNAGLGINEDFFIEAMAHHVGADRRHDVVWLLSQAAKYSDFWVLDVSALDVSTRLAY